MTDRNATVWVVDDDQLIGQSISLLLKKRSIDCQVFHLPKMLMDALNEGCPDVLILDMNFSIETTGRQGLAALKKVKQKYPDLPVILITGWGTVALAVEGMKLGAVDFMTKPWDNKRLLAAVEAQLEMVKTTRVLGQKEEDSISNIIGKSDAMLEIKDMIARIAKTNASVLITGESGTGKELVAEAIHYQSSRNQEPFVKVNLGGLSSSLFESELFGHVKGAFTDAASDRIGRFQKADRGTIFLDEIGDLALPLQVKLLRVLQEGTFEPIGSSQTFKTDVRVISATNKDLINMVMTDQFREDLFYRINLITLFIPPLRDRREDIPILVRSFERAFLQLYPDHETMISDEAVAYLQKQEFPGNVRQLKNIVDRALLLSSGSIIAPRDFQVIVQQQQGMSSGQHLPKVGEMSLEEMENAMIQRALAFHNGNITNAAKALGLTRSSLYRRLKKFDLGEY